MELEDGEMGLWKEEYIRGNPIFLVDFSSELFVGIGLAHLPRGFLWWAWTSLLEDRRLRWERSEKKKKKKK